MAFNWVGTVAQVIWADNVQVPGTNRHVQNWLLQKNTQIGEESRTADIGNGKTVTVNNQRLYKKKWSCKMGCDWYLFRWKKCKFGCNKIR